MAPPPDTPGRLLLELRRQGGPAPRAVRPARRRAHGGGGRTAGRAGRRRATGPRRPAAGPRPARPRPAETGWTLLLLEFRLLAARSPQIAAKLREHDRAAAEALAGILERSLPDAVPCGADACDVAAVLLAAKEGIVAAPRPGPGGRGGA
ncbi:hypothetical protein NKH77_42145 [Streptomyces sp. M19]